MYKYWITNVKLWPKHILYRNEKFLPRLIKAMLTRCQYSWANGEQIESKQIMWERSHQPAALVSRIHKQTSGSSACLPTTPTVRYGRRKPATTRQNTAQQQGIYFLTGKEEKSGKEGKQFLTPGDGAWRHFRFPFKFPRTDLDNVKGLAVFEMQGLDTNGTTSLSSL